VIFSISQRRKTMTQKEHLKPQARATELITQELPDEVLVYDLKNHKAHCLNRTAALVWQNCDGKTSVAGIAARMRNELGVPVGEEVVWFALDHLSKSQLLTERVKPINKVAIPSRRALLGKFGVATMLAVPLVMSVAAPTAAGALSCTLSNDSECRIDTVGCCCPSGMRCVDCGVVPTPAVCRGVTVPRFRCIGDSC
jgi:hypothetical protein